MFSELQIFQTPKYLKCAKFETPKYRASTPVQKVASTPPPPPPLGFIKGYLSFKFDFIRSNNGMKHVYLSLIRTCTC